MSANVEGMVREGIAAFKAGRKEEARALLSKAVDLDQFNEQAWMYLSGVVESPEDQRVCLENVLAINPMNERARKGLQYLEGQTVDFNKPKPPPAMPTSVEWEAPSDPSRPVSAFGSATPQISDEEYDNWVTGLNLPNNAAPAFATTPGGTAPINADEYESDLFTDGPFTPNAPIDIPGVSDEPPAAPAKRSTFEFNRKAAVLDKAAAESSPGKSRRELAREKKEAKRASREAARVKTKTSTNETSSIKISRDVDMFMPEVKESDYTLFDNIDPDGDGQVMEDGEGALFGFIPQEIKATRLPGTREKYPFVALFMLLLLIVINVAAVALLVMQVLDVLPNV
ncbi:MAG: tetratricopeptide repeat protein [bacterium]|nr:tetratricopeptide repeat protein [bacterium]